jgi:hypothetical protein
MHFLAMENDKEGLEWLYDEGADSNATNVSGESASEVTSLDYVI